MADTAEHSSKLSRSSRHRYRGFVKDYKQGRLDDAEEKGKKSGDAAKTNGEASSPEAKRGKRREYMRAYLRWLRPYRYAIGGLFLLALIAAGLEMIEPLFMRFIIDRILLNVNLNTATRLAHLYLAGIVFVSRH